MPGPQLKGGGHGGIRYMQERSNYEASIAAIPKTNGVCSRCSDIIEAKKVTGRYRPIKHPAKCAACGQKNVFQAYCTYCSACASSKRVCMRCGDARPAAREKTEQDEEVARLQAKLDQGGLREREVRSLLRKLEAAKVAKRARVKAHAQAAAEVALLSPAEIAKRLKEEDNTDDDDSDGDDEYADNKDKDKESCTVVRKLSDWSKHARLPAALPVLALPLSHLLLSRLLSPLID
mmetsp:Transcript_37153/g.74237  ORF Transcript_37153/g.74237 Transcript_37153/m.74237 type:complete len:234 (-) Transcript_37153:260-961(-)